MTEAGLTQPWHVARPVFPTVKLLGKIPGDWRADA
jgi:hypothetical protein